MSAAPLKFPAAWLLFIIFFATAGLSAEPDDEHVTAQTLAGKPVIEVLKVYSDQGIKLLFSTDFIPPTLTVLSEPTSSDPLQLIAEILSPHALKLRKVDDSYLIVKVAPGTPESLASSLLIAIRNPGSLGTLAALQLTAKPEITRREEHGRGLYEFFPGKPGLYSIEAKLPGYKVSRSTIRIDGSGTKLLSIALEPGPAELDNMTVSASRYVLLAGSRFVIDQRALKTLPKIGDDPIRSVQRLQGVAASGFSSKSYFRGGATNESSIYLNGVRLVEPFHIRDYQSIFSSIDTQAISSVQVYTGGFPAEYGDDLSGVLLLDSKVPAEPLHTELGLSLFYTSILNSGYAKEGRYDWLVSARRSNLNMVLNPEIGNPQYFDIFTTLGFNPDANTRISLNALILDDDVTIVIENDPIESEESASDTNNKTVWLRMENYWGDNLSASTTLLSSEFSNRRVAFLNDSDEVTANVVDDRNIKIYSLRSAMKYEGLNGHLLQWGLEFSRQSATYNYTSEAEYFGIISGHPDFENPVTNQIEANPEGNTYAVFLSDRFSVNDQLSFELGLRWDKQTYTKPTYSSQWSPRASMLYAFGNNQHLRFTIGRYYQSQAIQELQVEDNLSRFFKPQYADHIIAGYQWSTSKDYEFRVEAYYKNYRQMAPRFENLFDPLQVIPELQADRVRLDPQSASATGIEFSVEYGANRNFSWWASYTLSRAVDIIEGRSQRRYWDQLHAFQLGLGWQRGAWEIGLATRIRTGWPTTALNLEFDSTTNQPLLVPGPRNAEQLGAFASLDFRISRRFDVRVGKLTAFLEATNVTNRKNPCCLDYSTEEDPGGNILLDRKVEFWLPIIPSIGLLWAF